MALSLSSFNASSHNIERWLDAPGPTVHTVWYGTFDEFWSNAQFYWVAAHVCEDDLHALVCLWKRHLEQGEEFELRGSDLELFLGSFAANTGYGNAAVFAALEEAEWRKETSLVIEGICKAIADVRSGRRLVHGELLRIPEGPLDLGNTSTCWGIFENGQRVADEAAFRLSVPGNFVDGIAIRSEWNNQELFVRTTAAYGLFVWGTAV
jgi:hypothetical protein